MDPNIGDRFQLDGFSLDIGVRVRENGGQSQLTQKDGGQSTDWDLHFGLEFSNGVFWLGNSCCDWLKMFAAKMMLSII